VTYLDDLRRELDRVGIRGRRGRRILAEVADHLKCDPDAELRFGRPNELAHDFAAELGTTTSRRSAVAAFTALGLAGAVYAAAFVGANHAGPASADRPLASLAFAVIVVAPQLAFVTGTLALLRVFRLRGERVFSSSERTVIARRTGIALGSGVLTMAAWVAFALDFRGELAGWWVTLTLAGSGAAVLLLAAAGLPAIAAARLRPSVGGAAGDVFDDLGLERFRTEPWRFARRIALLVGLAVWIAGIAASDPFDGLLRGLVEAAACLGGFGLLGRYLGLYH
jgi:hypothetical protein